VQFALPRSRFVVSPAPVGPVVPSHVHFTVNPVARHAVKFWKMKLAALSFSETKTFRTFGVIVHEAWS
jgi:hypothetical protein